MAASSVSCTIPKDANYPNLKEASLAQMQFDFRSRVDIKRICANISAYVL